MEITVLGPGCANCQTLHKRAEEAVKKADIQATITKVSDYDEMLAYGILRTPGLVIDGRLVLSGRVPSVDELVTIIQRRPSMKIQVFDPPMCCSTGICGPSVDPELVRFAADLDWLKRQGIEVERYNLSQQPAAFVGNELVKAMLAKDGNDCLPLTLVDNTVICKGKYPTREALAGHAGIENCPSIFTNAVKELVAIGAAIGSNCEKCFTHHYNEARKLGVSKKDMRLAVEMAKTVNDAPSKSILALADKYLSEPQPPQKSSCCGGGKCCG